MVEMYDVSEDFYFTGYTFELSIHQRILKKKSTKI